MVRIEGCRAHWILPSIVFVKELDISGAGMSGAPVLQRPLFIVEIGLASVCFWTFSDMIKCISLQGTLRRVRAPIASLC